MQVEKTAHRVGQDDNVGQRDNLGQGNSPGPGGSVELKGKLWQRMIWPVLMPLLVVHGGLAALGLLIVLLPWETVSPNASRLSWLPLILVLGSIVGTVTALWLQYYHLQRRKDDLLGPRKRLLRLLDALHGELPAWLKAERLLAGCRLPREAETHDPLLRLECLLDALETLIERAARQSRLTNMLEDSSVPAFIAYRGRLVEANTAFQYAVGRRLTAEDGFALGDLMCTDSGAAPRGSMAGRVALSNSRGGSRHFQLYMFDDGHHHHLGMLVDDREQRRDIARLTLSRNQARQEARLRGDYLQLLQKELRALAQEAESAPPANPRLLKRLVDLDILSTHLAGVAPRFSAERQQKSELLRPWVLIVDDGPVSTLLARQALEAAGMNVDAVTSGEEALRMRETRHYDVVLMDIVMPGIDGLETSRRWRERERDEGQRSALVAFSANTDESDRQDFFEVGMDDYLAKPYRPKQLVETVRRWAVIRSTVSP